MCHSIGMQACRVPRCRLSRSRRRARHVHASILLRARTCSRIAMVNLICASWAFGNFRRRKTHNSAADGALSLFRARMRLFSGRVLGGGKLFRLRMPVRCWTRFLRVGHSACSSAQLRKPSVFAAALRCLKLRPFQSVLLYSLRIFSALPFIVVCIFYCLLGAKKTFLHVKGGFAAICTILEGFIL